MLHSTPGIWRGVVWDLQRSTVFTSCALLPGKSLAESLVLTPSGVRCSGGFSVVACYRIGSDIKNSFLSHLPQGAQRHQQMFFPLYRCRKCTRKPWLLFVKHNRCWSHNSCQNIFVCDEVGSARSCAMQTRIELVIKSEDAAWGFSNNDENVS